MSATTVEEILKVVEGRYSSFLQSQLVGVAISDGDETIYRMNDKFLKIIGYSEEELRAGKITWSTITHTKYDHLDRLKLDELVAFNVTDVFEKEYITKNGHSVPVVVGAELISQDPPLNISFAIDMSKQKQSEKEKDDLIATVGHELKTPLSVLRVQAQLLAMDVANGISTKKLLKNLEEFDDYIKQMDDILSHILIYNRPRMKKHATSTTEFDVAITLKKVIHGIKLLTERKIMLEHADKDCMMAGHEPEIREVLTNLVTNALRYSGDDTVVRVAVIREDDWIKVAVVDKGRGISKSDQKKIFQKSYQVRQPEDAVERSSRGLGLYLTKVIIKKHKGKIFVESEVGKGSTFTCCFKALHPE